MFKKGDIEGVIIKPLKKFVDERGWLSELFRHDEMEEDIYPVMAYVSVTLPGIKRGPHEHKNQWDYFCFLGPSNFKIVLWDNRKESRTFGNKMVIFAGEDDPKAIAVPPGVVHGYKNIGAKPGMVFNAPNKLYKGWGRKEPVDEIRHEEDPENPFLKDFDQ